jgi:predicted RNA-binding protein YlxR (DUF448 family)
LTATNLKARPLPQRTCVGCGTTTNKRELVRVVRMKSGDETTVVVDPTGKLAGRGAYVCGAAECWEAALGKGGLARTLKTTISEKDADAIREYAASLTGGQS